MTTPRRPSLNAVHVKVALGRGAKGRWLTARGERLTAGQDRPLIDVAHRFGLSRAWPCAVSDESAGWASVVAAHLMNELDRGRKDVARGKRPVGIEAKRRESVHRRATFGQDEDRGDPLAPWLRLETARVCDGHPAWWAAAGALLDDIDLGTEGQASERAAEGRGDG